MSCLVGLFPILLHQQDCLRFHLHCCCVNFLPLVSTDTKAKGSLGFTITGLPLPCALLKRLIAVVVLLALPGYVHGCISGIRYSLLSLPLGKSMSSPILMLSVPQLLPLLSIA